MVRSPQLGILFFSCASCQAGVHHATGLQLCARPRAVPPLAAPAQGEVSELSATVSQMREMLLITHYSVVRGRMLVLAGLINRDIGV